ncbi:MAG: substrate-binding domain-containing protein [Lentisphaeria bacterium]|nr:substrate-binding domain-containing protein [Lentisphaeria bacterium]
MERLFTFQFCRGSSFPKYQQFAMHLERQLSSGFMPPGFRIPGDRDFADRLGTTTATINKGIQELVKKGLLLRKVGSGTYVSELGAPRSRRIGIICHEVILPDLMYISPLLEHFHSWWEAKGYQLLTLRGSPENYRHLFQDFLLAGALILVPKEDFFPAIRESCQQGFPLVSIGFAHPEMPEISFGSNHEKTAEEAVDFLHSLGHTRIGFISFSERSSTLIRARGYAKSMFNAGLPIHPDWYLGQHGTGGIERALLTLRQGKNCPSAFLLAEANFILPFYNILRQNQILVPDDLSLVAFDDMPFLTEISPPLTVFKQHLEEFSGQAASQLEKMILGQVLEPINHENIGSTLVQRGSCRAMQTE